MTNTRFRERERRETEREIQIRSCAKEEEFWCHRTETCSSDEQSSYTNWDVLEEHHTFSQPTKTKSKSRRNREPNRPATKRGWISNKKSIIKHKPRARWCHPDFYQTFKDDPVHQSSQTLQKPEKGGASKPTTGGQHYPDAKARQGHYREIKLQVKFFDDHRHKHTSQNTDRSNTAGQWRVTHHNKVESFLDV